MISPDSSSSTETVGPNCINDQPTVADKIGFRPYVNALTAFLTHEHTRPPLVMSVEGPWGSGKSSLMLQLEDALNKEKGNATVWFNAWRFEKEESLWAAFALQFTTKLAETLGFCRRMWCHLQILWLRYDLRKGWLGLAKFILLSAAFISIGVIATQHLYHFRDLRFFSFPEDKTKGLGELALIFLFRFGGLAGYIFLGFFLLKKSIETIGNPLEVDLKRFIRSPKYDEHVDFIDKFHADFSRIVKIYANGRRVFVFVDDLDRCEIPKAAELMQALNLLISESAPIFYILGVDREKVAAGLAIKFEKLIPYLGGPVGANGAYTGLEFGFAFLEKFIQVPFQVPTPAVADIRKLLKSLQSSDAISTEAAVNSSIDSGLLIELGPDSETVLQVVDMVTPYLEFNPRRVKQFLNLFRLRAFLASQTGLFGAPRSHEFDRLTLFQLGKITAISLCWPVLIGDMQTDPKLLSELQELACSEDGEPKSPAAKHWASHSRLTKLIAYGVPKGFFSVSAPSDEIGFDARTSRELEYGLYRVDVERILRIAPPLERPSSRSEDVRISETKMPEPRFSESGDWERDWVEEGSGVEFRPRSWKKSPRDIKDLSDDPGSN